MAKVSYVINKNSSGNGKSNFHFDGNGSKLFSKFFGNTGKHETVAEPNVTDLLSKLVVDGEYSISKNSETRIEFEGSVEEIKEFAAWSINQVKAEASALKNIAEFVKEYCKSIVDIFKGIFGYTEHVEQIQAERDQFEAENKRLSEELKKLSESFKEKSEFDPDAKVEKQKK